MLHLDHQINLSISAKTHLEYALLSFAWHEGEKKYVQNWNYSEGTLQENMWDAFIPFLLPYLLILASVF